MCGAPGGQGRPPPSLVPPQSFREPPRPEAGGVGWGGREEEAVQPQEPNKAGESGSRHARHRPGSVTQTAPAERVKRRLRHKGKHEHRE